MRSFFAPSLLLFSATFASGQNIVPDAGTELWADTICFAEGTPPAYKRARESALPQVSSFNNFNRWPGTQGSPVTVTWSFVPDGLNIPDGIGEGPGPSTLFATLDGAFSNSGGRAVWIERIQQSFDRWEELSGINFVRRTNGTDEWDDGALWDLPGNSVRGDIRIGAKFVDGQSGVLAYASFPSAGNMVLDMDETWQSGPNQNRFARNILMHEIGHAIGIAHVCSSNATYLMEPFLTTFIDGPHHDDIRAVQRHYGDLFENDNNIASANDLGTLPAFLDVGAVPPPVTGATPTNSSTLSLDNSFEADWFRFNIAENSEVTITARPVGMPYDDSDQLSDGSCASGNQINSRNIADPSLTLLDSTGTITIASSAGGGLGESEQISTPLAAGDYAIEIRNDIASNVQLYDLEIESTPLATCNTTASVATRTGGANLNGLTASRPVLGAQMTFTAIATYNTGFLLAYGNPGNFTLGNGQILLVELGPSFLFSMEFQSLPFGSVSIDVPPDSSLCGFKVYTQALLLGPTQGGPPFQLTNSQDLTLGS